MDAITFVGEVTSADAITDEHVDAFIKLFLDTSGPGPVQETSVYRSEAPASTSEAFALGVLATLIGGSAFTQKSPIKSKHYNSVRKLTGAALLINEPAATQAGLRFNHSPEGCTHLSPAAHLHHDLITDAAGCEALSNEDTARQLIDMFRAEAASLCPISPAEHPFPDIARRALAACERDTTRWHDTEDYTVAEQHARLDFLEELLDQLASHSSS